MTLAMGSPPLAMVPVLKARFGLHSLALRGIVLALRSGRHLCGSNLHLLTVGNGGSLAFSDHNALGITDHLVCSFNTSLATLAGNTQCF